MTAATSPALEGNVPATMVDALETEDPCQALLALSEQSQAKAHALSQALAQKLLGKTLELPDVLEYRESSHPVSTAMACSDSILHSLTKIATGGSQASQEIQALEDEKRNLERHAQDVETALQLREASNVAAQAVSASRYDAASQAIHQYRHLQKQHKVTQRAQAYAGEYTITQLEATQSALQKTLLEQYQTAVQNGDLQNLGQLTPLLQRVQMEQQAVELYLRYLKALLQQQLDEAAAADGPPHVPMAKIYNAAVTVIRHHLPLVAHCLHAAQGDAALVQLVHVQVETGVEPLLQKYLASRQLAKCARNALQVYETLEARYGVTGVDDAAAEDEDGGFTALVGSLADVDAAMEEAALSLQHAESYMRFLHHTVDQVQQARILRKDQERQERSQMDEWGNEAKEDNEEEGEDPPLQILPAQTKLQEMVAEMGGYYSGIERCLLLASMQRTFRIDDDPRHFSPLGIKSTIGGKACKSSIVESSLYAARRGTQRAFATGHTGTASAVANYAADCLKDVLLPFLSRRAQDHGIPSLKPGDGLLAGSTGLANVLLRGGQTEHVDNVEKQRQLQEGIALACSTLNDLVVAAQHTGGLATILEQLVQQGFPPTEQEALHLCVQSLNPVSESFGLAADAAVEALVGVLKPRIRAIVTDAVGGESGAFSLGGTKGTDRHMVRMNYNLNEEAYQLLEVSEGYISRL